MQFCSTCKQMVEGSVSADGKEICAVCGSPIVNRQLLSPGKIINGFAIVKELGRGGMGVVYLAKQVNLERYVAVKVLEEALAQDTAYVEGFFREARAAASLSHPNIVQAYDAGITDEGIHYFVMELIDGENLDQYVAKYGALDIVKGLEIARDIAAALAYAWERQNLCHGDIKPENIIMKLNGEIKLADLGLARDYKKDKLSAGDIMATPAYAPPEIIRGEFDKIDFKSDMYSFGATLYHLFAGTPPFPGDDPAEVCQMQLNNQPKPLIATNKDIPPAMSILVDQLMEKAPRKRPASWREVTTAISSILDKYHASRESVREQVRSELQRQTFSRRITLFLSVGFPILLVVTAVLFLIILTQKANSKASAKPATVTAPAPKPTEPAVTWVEPVETPREAQLRIGRTAALAAWNALSGSLPDIPVEEANRQIEQYYRQHGEFAPKEAAPVRQEYQRKARYDRSYRNFQDLCAQISELERNGAYLDTQSAQRVRQAEEQVRRLLDLGKSLSDTASLLKDKRPLLSSADREKFTRYANRLTAASKKLVDKERQLRQKQERERRAERERLRREHEEQQKRKLAVEQESKEFLAILQQIPHVRKRTDIADMLKKLDAWNTSYAGFIPEEHAEKARLLRLMLTGADTPLWKLLQAAKSNLRGKVLYIDEFPHFYFISADEDGICFFRNEGPAQIGEKRSWKELPKRNGSPEDLLTLRLLAPSLLSCFSAKEQAILYRKVVIFDEIRDKILNDTFRRHAKLKSADLKELAEAAKLFRE